MTLGKSGSSFKNGSGSGVCDLIERKGIKPKCKNSEFGVLFCIEWVLTLNSITQHYSLIHCWLGLRAAIGSSIWPRAPMTRVQVWNFELLMNLDDVELFHWSVKCMAPLASASVLEMKQSSLCTKCVKIGIAVPRARHKPNYLMFFF